MVRRQESVTNGIQHSGQNVTSMTATVTQVIQSGAVVVRVRTFVFIHTGHCGTTVGVRDMKTIDAGKGMGDTALPRPLRESFMICSLLFGVGPCLDAATICL